MSEEKIDVLKVAFDDRELIFETANQATLWRAQTLFQKEPDTIAWIRQFQPGEVMLDIGANVGMYTILAAAGRDVSVYAFEPEAQNFAQLNRNIVFNGVGDRALAFPLALADTAKVDRLYLSAFGLGGSCHTFGESLDYHLQSRAQGITQGCVCSTLDTLLDDGVIPPAHHIKIDVDGFEHLVIQGGAKVFAQPQLKSVLVELNTRLSEHQALIEYFSDLGFRYEPGQVEIGIRKEGSFAGIGNFIFSKPEAGISFADLQQPAAAAPAVHMAVNDAPFDQAAVKAHVIERFKSQPAAEQPYPHLYVEDVFPSDYYQLMQSMKPADEELICIDDTGRAKGFRERFVVHLGDDLERIENLEKRRFWQAHYAWFNAQDFMIEMIRPYQQAIVRAGIAQLNVKSEAMFMRDRCGYSIGPHTDSPARLLSVMFYLPEDSAHEHVGTGVYIPREQAFTCDGSGHHEFAQFEQVFRAPFKPNSAFGFLKTNNSFHAVPRMEEDYRRDTMVYIVKHKMQNANAA